MSCSTASYETLKPSQPKKNAHKDALDHKKSASDQTEATDISTFPTPDLNDTFFKYEPGIPPILFPDRFTCKVPDHFFCQICCNIVKDPQECTSCETLFCLLCTQTIACCPAGCSKLEFKQISKFAYKMYNALSLSCKNQIAGCNFVSTLDRVLTHEETCEYSVLQCENVLCDRLIVKSDCREMEGPLLCSELCEEVIGFSVTIDEGDVFGTLESFREYLERCKKIVELEVKEELREKMKKIEDCVKVNEEYRKRKERVEREIGTWKSAFHPGKWNVRTCKWTCCGCGELVSVGCRHIQ